MLVNSCVQLVFFFNIVSVIAHTSTLNSISIFLQYLQMSDLEKKQKNNFTSNRYDFCWSLGIAVPSLSSSVVVFVSNWDTRCRKFGRQL